jgi:aspartyl-tRNA(Asn)/glutamyl-tRNA(Gln) amidotransferase subunit C
MQGVMPRTQLTESDVRHVATLARLALDDAEIASQSKHLNNLIAQFDRLQELDTTGVAPTSHPVPVVAVLREDEIRPSLSLAEVLANGSETDEYLGGFIVPQVLAE